MLPDVRDSFVQGLYFWFRVLIVIIPVYQYIKSFFLRFSTPATGTLRSWSARHQFDACASRWCPTDANLSALMVRAVSTFSFVLREEMKTSVGILKVKLYIFRVSLLNSWPSNATWWHRLWPTLAQVMACCLETPSHYLNQYWLIITKVQWHSFECNFTIEYTSAINH